MEEPIDLMTEVWPSMVRSDAAAAGAAANRARPARANERVVFFKATDSTRSKRSDQLTRGRAIRQPRSWALARVSSRPGPSA